MQLSRKAGFNLQAASKALNGLPAKRITRPGPWGNPFTIEDTAAKYGLDPDAAQAKAVALCGEWLRGTLDPKLSPGDRPRARRSAASSPGTILHAGANRVRRAMQTS